MSMYNEEGTGIEKSDRDRILDITLGNIKKAREDRCPFYGDSGYGMTATCGLTGDMCIISGKLDKGDYCRQEKLFGVVDLAKKYTKGADGTFSLVADKA